MKTKFTLLMLFCLICSSRGLSQNSKNVMSESYYNIWNEQVQNKINAEIEKNRKSNAVLKFENLPLGSQIKVEQISHDFLFGGKLWKF